MLFRLYDAQMMDRHCVNKMSVIILLQPMDCQRAVYVLSGSEQVLNEAGWTGSDESTRCCSIALNPKKPVCGEEIQKDD